MDDAIKYSACCSTPGRRGLFGLIMVLLTALAVGLGLGFGVLNQEKAEEIVPPSKSCVGVETAYTNGAVASDSDVCSKVGRDILQKEKGSAVDAAIATLICLGVVNRQGSGLGGGFFMTIYDKKNKKVETLDARDVAPLRANRSMFANGDISSLTGGLAIAVPGELAGYKKAHEKYGKLEWKKLFEPSIRMSKGGIAIGTAVSQGLAHEEELIKANPILSAAYVNPKTGELLKKGDIVKYPRLAKTLQTIAEDGADAFYNGSLTPKIVKEIQDAGGIITEEDLHRYKAIWKEPVSIRLSDTLRLNTVRPPSSGALISFILNIVKGFDFSEDSMASTESKVRTYHRLIEAYKFAYARRAELGDENFVNMTNILADILSTDYVSVIRSRITNITHPPSYYGNASGQISPQGTSHLSVVSPDGDAVAVTSSINYYFGSKVAGNVTGILYNDGMDDFTTSNKTNAYGLPPSASNFIEPGKRPMSSMSPTIIVDNGGHVKLVIGASGGSKIISATTYCTIRALMFGESIKQAIDYPRLHNQWVPTITNYDADFPQDILAGLRKLGHTFKVGGGANVQAVLRRNGKLYPYSDTQRGGCPSGY